MLTEDNRMSGIDQENKCNETKADLVMSLETISTNLALGNLHN